MTPPPDTPLWGECPLATTGDVPRGWVGPYLPRLALECTVPGAAEAPLHTPPRGGKPGGTRREVWTP